MPPSEWIEQRRKTCPAGYKAIKELQEIDRELDELGAKKDFRPV